MDYYGPHPCLTEAPCLAVRLVGLDSRQSWELGHIGFGGAAENILVIL